VVAIVRRSRGIRSARSRNLHPSISTHCFDRKARCGPSLPETTVLVLVEESMGVDALARPNMLRKLL
jgi:hypothetical protein